MAGAPPPAALRLYDSGLSDRKDSPYSTFLGQYVLQTDVHIHGRIVWVKDKDKEEEWWLATDGYRWMVQEKQHAGNSNMCCLYLPAGPALPHDEPQEWTWYDGAKWTPAPSLTLSERLAWKDTAKLEQSGTALAWLQELFTESFSMGDTRIFLFRRRDNVVSSLSPYLLEKGESSLPRGPDNRGWHLLPTSDMRA